MKIGAFTKTYEGRKVLDFPGAELICGTVTAVIGANGSGKSTFAKVLSGITPADAAGRILPDGISCGYMPQKSYAFQMSVWKNILLNGGNAEKAKELMDRLDLAALMNAGGKTLSGGETARMVLARILMKHYDLLILDEPCASMDMRSTIASEQLIAEYAKKENAAVLLITHSLAQAERTASDLLFFDEGKLCDDPGKKEEYFRFYGSEKREAL